MNIRFTDGTSSDNNEYEENPYLSLTIDILKVYISIVYMSSTVFHRLFRFHKKGTELFLRL
jgi:hypothetical protein